MGESVTLYRLSGREAFVQVLKEEHRCREISAVFFCHTRAEKSVFLVVPAVGEARCFVTGDIFLYGRGRRLAAEGREEEGQKLMAANAPIEVQVDLPLLDASATSVCLDLPVAL